MWALRPNFKALLYDGRLMGKSQGCDKLHAYSPAEAGPTHGLPALKTSSENLYGFQGA